METVHKHQYTLRSSTGIRRPSGSGGMNDSFPRCGGTIFEIHIMHGFRIMSYSEFPDEQEVLLPPDFTVKWVGNMILDAPRPAVHAQ